MRLLSFGRACFPPLAASFDSSFGQAGNSDLSMNAARVRASLFFGLTDDNGDVKVNVTAVIDALTTDRNRIDGDIVAGLEIAISTPMAIS
ncbi:hypothetical protein [Brevundimonas sp. SH203]|uniref:hypothetical protein n=1 Tax=Brevundimonas sp. SH203 TaxID=345167 RepID=UPI00117868AB|nr:hypothetical protein [Brevundimonas sp. SH203]